MPHTIKKRLNDLIQLLEQTRDLYEQLLQTIHTKIDAMRHADLHEMREQTQKEHALAKQLHEREGLRCQIMELIGIELQLTAPQARAMTMSNLSKAVSKNEAQRLMEISNTLRETVTRVAQANRIAGSTTREILNHLKWVMDSVKPRDDQPVSYSGDGTIVPSHGTKLFETIG